MTTMQVIILGMHRSGTSLAGQVLESLGYQFGPEDLAAAPKKDNPKGYWERRDVIQINDKAFAALGMTWERAADWEPGKLPDAFLREFDAQARAIIAEYPAGKSWFMKDPRICLTLPLWEKHLDNPIYIFAYRDPVEISRSLWTRNRHPPRLVMAVWERYMADALNATRGKRRVLLRYGDLIQNPKAALLKLVADLRQLGVETPCTPESALEKLEVDDTLRHHQRDPLKLEIPFTESQKMLNRRLQSDTALEQTEWVDASDANRQIAAYRKTVEAGEPQALETDASPGNDESLSRFSRELAAGISPSISPKEASALANRLLKIARDAFTEKGGQVMEALEPIHLLHLHLKRARPGVCTAGADYGVAALSNWCDQLSRWRPLQPRYQKARRLLLNYASRPPVTFYEFISRSKVASGKLWAQKLVAAGQGAESLLGDFILGKLPLLPATTGDDKNEAELLALLKTYHASLKESASRVRQALEPIESFAAHLEQSCGNKHPFEPGKSAPKRQSDDATKKQADFALLLDWGVRLCLWNPLSAARRSAVREFRNYKKAAGAIEVMDLERFRFMAPAARIATQRLGHLLNDLEQAVEATGKICAALENR